MQYYKNKNRRTRLTNVAIVWFFAVAALAALVVGQNDPAGDGAVVLAGTVAAPTDASTADQSEILEAGTESQAIQTITFNKEMTIKDALRFLALKYQRNIVPSSKVDGQITITNLYDVTFEEALQAVIETNKYEVQGNFIRVYTAEEFEKVKADKRRMEYKVFTLHYLTADEAQKLTSALLSSNASIATSSPASTGVPTGQSISSDSAGGDNLAFQDTIVVRDYPENIAQIEELLKRLDVRPRQVLVEATILSATLTEGMEFGIDLSLAGGVAITGASATDTYTTTTEIDRGSAATTPISQIAGWTTGGTPIEVAGFAKAGGNGLRLGIRAGDLSVFISALESITDVTVLANPKILAVNKQLGQVYIGTKLGYREASIITDGGATQEGSVKFLDTGTKLSFRPYIGDDGYIRMQIHPKDSSGSLNSQGVPDEISAELATNVMVKDGQTIVIGGLFRDVASSTKSQVPLLGDIPVIGELFKGTTDSNVRQEVIVLLTPHIIDSPAELDGDQRTADVERKRLGARDALHWLGAGRLAEDSYSKAVALYSAGDTEAALCELNWTLHLRPTYIEALRLRERIVRETSDDSADAIERVMLGAIEREDSQKWIRR
jgi:type IV pilus assembly protein PilQ